MKITEILATQDEGVVRIGHDYQTDTYSIGLRTNNKLDMKYISKKLYNLLIEELSTQETQNDIFR